MIHGTIYRTSTGYIVRTDDPEVLRLFGTDTLPLPWRRHANPRIVYQDYTRRNPGRAVDLVL